MIYHLYFALIMAGYSACGLLLGSYVIYYGGAREIDLGYLFMIQPMTIFLRPLICARADRLQAHKQMLSIFALITSLAYLPFIVIPFLWQPRMASTFVAEIGASPASDSQQTWLDNERVRFWILAGAHLVGSVGFCGVRSLGDALAVNYAKTIGTAYARYRKYGAISFGLCGYLLGYINQGWLLPDFVPSFIVYSASFFSLAALVYAWPDQYFKIVRHNSQVKSASHQAADQEQSWPSAGQIAGHMLGRWGRLLSCKSCTDQQQVISTNSTKETSATSPPPTKLSVKQQLSIFLLLVRRDFRISLYLLIILYGGLVGYAGPNFVFTYLNKTCHEKGTCNAAQLSGLVMISYCTLETICYIFIDKLRGRLNRLIMLEITFVSLAVHYYFFGFALDHLSPYFFLIESLHGLEYSLSLTTSVELGYLFGNEVELIIPELVERKIIEPEQEGDNYELVKVSLMATMSGCFTLVYDGFGCILGTFIYGLVTGTYSFVVTWILIGSLASIGFFSMLLVHTLGKCFKIRPQILRDGSGLSSKQKA